MSGCCYGRRLVAVNTIEDNRPRELTTVSSTAKTESVSTILESVMNKLPSEISSEQKQRAQNLLAEYTDIFSTDAFDMGRMTLTEHTIDTGNHRPIRQPLRRHPWAHLDEIDNQVEGLLDNRLFEPADSPWASNVVSVKKKDGTFRLCIDYGRLNSITY